MKTIDEEIREYEARAEVSVWDGPSYRVRHRILGAGPPLVVAQGIAATYRTLAPLLNRLARRFRTVLADFPGENEDDGAKLEEITHDSFVETYLGLADHLGLDRFFGLGISFGSTIVLGSLLRQPGRFDRFMLQGGFAHRPLRWTESIALAFGRNFPGAVGSLPFYRPILTMSQGKYFRALPPDRWEAFVRENRAIPIPPYVRRLDIMGQVDLRPELAEHRPTTPALLFHGDDDNLVPLEAGRELVSLLPEGTLHVVPGAGHQLHYTHAEEFARLASSFLVDEKG